MSHSGSKLVNNLYTAGQEPTGPQGTKGRPSQEDLIAGINAPACAPRSRNRLFWKRSDAYIGVMIDDLVARNQKALTACLLAGPSTGWRSYATTTPEEPLRFAMERDMQSGWCPMSTWRPWKKKKATGGRRNRP